MRGGYPRNVTGGQGPGSYDYAALNAALGPEKTSAEDDWMAMFEALFGAGGLGGGTDNSLGWAQLAQSQQEFAQRMALEQQALAQQADMARLQREQQQREMAGALGQALNQLSSQNWETGLPWTLPKGTQHAPGFEPGGPASNIARIGGTTFTPQPLAVSNPPSRETLSQWLDDALSRWGPR